ncbi:hypothetical protein MNBD_GAMMA20-1465 [hydrothermal vent metagenome]|uniref:Uncharacterized protein n=1 Tax=hydrothermal vent metagenome TaxID=652676 RepID=A0A3B1A5V7_9ZZZZ
MSRTWLPYLLLSVLALSGCDSDPHESTVSLQSGHLILDSGHGNGGSAWGLVDCAACHPLSLIHRRALRIRDMVRDKGFDSCTGCHGGNGTRQPRRCVLCHNPDDLPSHPLGNGVNGHDFVKSSREPLNDEQCLVCHVASDMNGYFDINRDLTRLVDVNGLATHYASLSDFCLRCHNRDHQQAGFEITTTALDDPLIAIEDAWRYADKHGWIDGGGRTYAGLRDAYVYTSRVACTDCHVMHGTQNTGLIIDRSDKGASRLMVAFSQRAWPVVIREGDFSQLCVLCHAMKIPLEQGGLDAGNGLRGVHRVGEDCRPCHQHGEALQAGM